MNQIRLPARVATIELSNICNAKCRWCTMGIRNRTAMPEPRFMAPKLFAKGLDRLLELGWINEHTKIEPYSWTEPFLCPDLVEILRLTGERDLRFWLSTNGSRYRKLPPDVLGRMDSLMVSVPGFSQASYDRIHQLDAKAVRANIERFAADLAEVGASNKLVVNLHIYQFNLGEIEQVREFTEKLGAVFSPHVAYFADYEQFQQYLTGTMGAKDLWDASRDLFLNIYHFDGVQEGYTCLQWNSLCFDEQFNMIPCDRLPPEDAIGNLFTDDPEELLDKWRAFAGCRECIAAGQSTIVTNGTNELLPLWYTEQLLPKIKRGGVDLQRAQEENSRLDTARVRLEQEKQGLEEDVSSLEKKRLAAEQDAAMWHEAYDGLIHSKSWRLTEPLRALRRAIMPKDGQ